MWARPRFDRRGSSSPARRNDQDGEERDFLPDGCRRRRALRLWRLTGALCFPAKPASFVRYLGRRARDCRGRARRTPPRRRQTRTRRRHAGSGPEARRGLRGNRKRRVRTVACALGKAPPQLTSTATSLGGQNGVMSSMLFHRNTSRTNRPGPGGVHLNSHSNVCCG